MFKQLLSVFLQTNCVFCDRSTANICCEYCYEKLNSHQLNQHQDYLSKSFQSPSSQNLPVFSWGMYEGQLKRAIALMKYNNYPEIGDLLGQMLGQAWLESELSKSVQNISDIVVVPIPLHQERLKQRGFNQAETIAKGFCKSTGYGLNTQALFRVRNTRAMYELSPNERSKNLQNAFKLGRKPSQESVLLLDDVYTLGTTVQESAKVLRRHGIKVVGATVVARAEKIQNL